MPTAAFATLGCKVNQYETQRILDDFEERGFAITEFNAPADVYVINTCSVTQAAERKSRQMVRRLARQNPEAVVVMTGCYGEMARIKGEAVDEASLVVPNAHKLETLARVLDAYPSLVRAVDCEPRPRPDRPHAGRTRATIKVQDGCNVFCSFCSIPFTRSVMASRPPAEIEVEVRSRADQGFREIVITGVLVGAYCAPVSDAPRGDREIDLAELLMRLARVPGIERVRLSSIEPTQVTDRLLDAFASEPKLCRHLHIPLQSGDSGVLRAMNRPYDRDFYLGRCAEAHRQIADLAITSDILVGFPGEDRAAFDNTIGVVRQVNFARAHIFRYSPRPNTPAALLRDQVPDAQKEARSRELAAVCREEQQRFIARYVGRTLDVLVEGKQPGARTAEGQEGRASGNDDHAEELTVGGESGGPLLGGYTSNYIRVQFTGGSHLVGRVVPIHLIEPAADGAIGEVGGAHFGPLEAPPDAEFIPLATFAARV